MPTIDFDFQRYVARRKGARAAEVREGTAYAYSGDLRVRRTLERLRPVTLALEASVRLWRTRARAELLGTAIRITGAQFPAVFAAAQRVSAGLHVKLPELYVSPQLDMGAATLGTEEDAAIVLDAALVERLSPLELDFVLGRQAGHFQNLHMTLLTTLYFLRHGDTSFVRWVVVPAVAALEAWSLRAEVTADRAGLVCVRDLDAAVAALRAAALFGDDAAMKQATTASQPTAVREAALQVFAETSYYCGLLGESGGLTSEACDARVAELLGKGAKGA